MAKHTLKDYLRAGLLASGWKAVETRSDREAFTKAGNYIWLGENGSARVSPTSRRADSRGMLPRNLAALIQRGRETLDPPKAPPTAEFF